MAKIVIVDDQPEICESIRRRLSEDGHDVKTACVGDEAIDFGYLFKPDILITDWRLENEYDGLEVAEAFRFANENVTTILITGHSISEKELNSRGKIYASLCKPFSLEKITKLVDDALAEKDVSLSFN